MRKSELKPDMIVLVKDPRSRTGWDDASNVGVGKIVQVGKLRQRRDVECDEVVVEEWKSAPMRAYVLLLGETSFGGQPHEKWGLSTTLMNPRSIKSLAEAIEGTDDDNKLDWSVTTPLLLPLNRLRSVEDGLHLEEEATSLRKLNKARGDRVTMLQGELSELLKEHVILKLDLGRVQVRFHSEYVQVTLNENQPVKDLPAEVRTKATKLQEEIEEIISCIRKRR